MKRTDASVSKGLATEPFPSSTISCTPNCLATSVPRVNLAANAGAATDAGRYTTAIRTNETRLSRARECLPPIDCMLIGDSLALVSSRANRRVWVTEVQSQRTDSIVSNRDHTGAVCRVDMRRFVQPIAVPRRGSLSRRTKIEFHIRSGGRLFGRGVLQQFP